MLNEKVQDAFNTQLNAELYSSYLYLSMSAYFEDINLPGFASWMRVQAEEELIHVMKFFGFIVERNGKMVMTAIDAPPTSWDSPLAVFGDAYKHECKISGNINELVNLAMEQKDYSANAFLQWFVTEQVEEENTADQVVQQLKLMADAPGGLFMLDRELAARVFMMPPAGEAN